jgi:hypothetical protein
MANPSVFLDVAKSEAPISKFEFGEGSAMSQYGSTEMQTV